MRNGFISILGLLLVILLIGIWFVKSYGVSNEGKNEKETYIETIERTEELKRTIESRSNINFDK